MTDALARGYVTGPEGTEATIIGHAGRLNVRVVLSTIRERRWSWSRLRMVPVVERIRFVARADTDDNLADFLHVVGARAA